MKIGRWVVDGHIHCGKKDAISPNADQKLAVRSEVVEVDNSDWQLFDMDAYGIDMGILLPSFTGTTNEMRHGYGAAYQGGPRRNGVEY
jgi:hypothetical protein